MGITVLEGELRQELVPFLRQSEESKTLSALKVVFGFRDYNERYSAGVLCPQRCIAGTVWGQFHSSARNFIKSGSSRQRRFLGRCGLNLTSSFRKRSGVSFRYRSVEPNPHWPMYAESAGIRRFRSARCRRQLVRRCTANVARKSCIGADKSPRLPAKFLPGGAVCGMQLATHFR